MLSFLLTSIILISLTPVSYADTLTWVGGPSGDINDPANWSGGFVPFDDAQNRLGNDGQLYFLDLNDGQAQSLFGDVGTPEDPGVPSLYFRRGHLGAGDVITLNHESQGLFLGSITNDGQIILNNGQVVPIPVSTTPFSPSDSAVETIDGIPFYREALHLSGSGELVLAGANDQSSLTAQPLINGTNHTIRGGGHLTSQTVVGTRGVLDNRGTLIADSDLRALVIDPGNINFADGGAPALGFSAETVLNTGLIRAQGLAGIELRGGRYENAGGTIQVDANSQLIADGGPDNYRLADDTLVFPNGVNTPADEALLANFEIFLAQEYPNFRATPELRGGVIQNDGTVEFDDALLGDNIQLSGAGTYSIDNGSVLTIDSAVLDGTITVDAVDTNTDLHFIDGGVLAGSGTVLIDSALERITTDGGTGTIGTGVTVVGGGNILDDTGSLLNQGSITANLSNVDLVINPSAAGSLVNQGQINADGGDVRLNEGTINNDFGGSINVSTGSTVSQFSSTVTGGGTINIAAGGSYEVNFAALEQNIVNNEGTLRLGAGTDSFLGHGLALNGGGSVEVDNGHTLNAVGGLITNNSTINLNGTSTNTTLVSVDGLTLGGTGQVVLSSNFDQVLTQGVLINESGHTIRGGGVLLGDSGSLINRGSVVADLNGVDLFIDPITGGQMTNQGQVTADGGNLHFNNGIIENQAGGSINVEAGSSISQLSSTVNGNGTINVAAGGTYNVNFSALEGNTVNNAGTVRLGAGTNSFLGDGLTFNGSGSVEVDDGHVLNLISGSTTNNSTINLNGTTTATLLTTIGDHTLGGTGEVVLSSALDRVITDGSTLTNGVGHTIRGGGSVIDDTGSLINQGAITADDATLDLIVDAVTGGQVTNQGRLNAAGGDLQLNSTIIDNQAGGSINVAAGSTVSQFQSTVTGDGTINVDAGGTYVVNQAALLRNTVNIDGSVTLLGGSSSFLGEGLTLNGPGSVDVQANHVLNLVGGNTVNNTTIDVAQFADIELDGDHVLEGSGELRIVHVELSRTETLTNGANHTIRGTGEIGFTEAGDAGGFINHGIVRPENGAITIRGTATNGITNTGVISVEEFATVNFHGDDATVENSGLIESSGAVAQVNVAGNFINSGELRLGARTLFGGSSFVQTGGSTTIDGLTQFLGTDTQFLGGTLAGTGTIRDIADSNLIIDQGGALLAPGPEGALTFDIDVVIGSQGLLTVALFGADAQISSMQLQRSVTIDGILDLQLDADFAETLEVGDMFELFTGASIGGGGFSAVDLTAIGFDATGFGFVTQQIGNSLFLTVSETGVVPTGSSLGIGFLSLVTLWIRRRNSTGHRRT